MGTRGQDVGEIMEGERGLVREDALVLGPQPDCREVDPRGGRLTEVVTTTTIAR